MRAAQRKPSKYWSLLVVGLLSAAALGACSNNDEDPLANVTSPPGEPTEITVVTHDSFAVPDELVSEFEKANGLKLKFVAPGDAGLLVNQLILTKDAPLGDVVFGIDNTFATRLADTGVIYDYSPDVAKVPAAADAAQYQVGSVPGLTAIDFSDVCLNADIAYFQDKNLEIPVTFDDLLKPEYSGLLSVTNPATSSPGMSLLLATIAAKGDGWKSYWEQLTQNDLRVTGGWSDTYFVDFSVPNYGGDFPLVLSYASSPPSEIGEDGQPASVALLETCFRQVEYAGVLAGTNNPTAAGLVVDWLLSDEVQSSVPDNMYVYPVSQTATIPEAWKQHAPLATTTWQVDPAEIDANRDQWIRDWTAIVVE